ncbi:WXG100-like domain-containing protein [Streptomyces sp. BE303]|uniref:WXG100 family type VII secretion target n=1 Tax=Streptomyces sp. BE303 TaxID=3002528 RepID=UPI003FA77C07
MAQALNPGEVMAAADPWRRAADTLKAIRTTLTRASTEAATSWEGTTSDAFHTRMLHLAATINNAASYANDAAITLKAVSEAIAKAKRDMPEEPGGWDQLTDGVGDTFSALFGADDEDSRTALADQRKLEAATVMQTLAMHYRTAAPMLKPPQPMGAPTKVGKGEVEDIPPPMSGGDSGAAGAGTLMAGASLGSSGVGSGGFGGDPVRSGGRSEVPLSKRVAGDTTAVMPARGDSGIKGGTPTTVAPGPRHQVGTGPGVVDGAVAPTPPKPPSSGKVGPGVLLDGIVPISGGSGVSGPASMGAGHAAPVGPVGGPGESGVGPALPGAGLPGRALKGGSVFEPGEAQGNGGSSASATGRGMGGVGASGTTAGALPAVGQTVPGVRSGSGSARKVGGVVGAGERQTGGATGREKQVFTEGGSGLGARGRMRPDGLQGNTGQPFLGAGPFPGTADSRARRNQRERDGRRPDYLVEDEETWLPDRPANPKVVE